MPTTRRRYDYRHQRERDRWAPSVEAGLADCAEVECVNPYGRHIEPGTRWDLAHDRSTGGYRGPAHTGCNRREGAIWGNKQRAGTASTGTPSDAW